MEEDMLLSDDFDLLIYHPSVGEEICFSVMKFLMPGFKRWL